MSLTAEQTAVLRRLTKAYAAVHAYHGDTEDQIQEDRAAFKKAFNHFARIAKVARDAGLLVLPHILTNEAVHAAFEWLPMLERRRRDRRQTMKGEEAPGRQLWSQYETWMAKRVNALRRQVDAAGKPRSQTWIKAQIVRELEKKNPEFASILKEMSQQAWNKRFRQFFVETSTPSDPK